MLHFYRKAWRSGKIVLKDQDPQGNVVNIVLTVAQNGQTFEAQDEAFVKAGCPQFVFTEEEWPEVVVG